MRDRQAVGLSPGWRSARSGRRDRESRSLCRRAATSAGSRRAHPRIPNAASTVQVRPYTGEAEMQVAAAVVCGKSPLRVGLGCTGRPCGTPAARRHGARRGRTRAAHAGTPRSRRRAWRRSSGKWTSRWPSWRRRCCLAMACRSPSTIWRFLDRHDIIIRKTAHASEQERPEVAMRRQAWFDAQPDLDPQRLVFIDETGASHRCATRERR